MGRRWYNVTWTKIAARHFRKHSVSESEVRELVAAGFVVVPGAGGKMRALGMTNQARMLALIIEERESGLWSAVSARKMEPGEVVLFVEMGGLE